MSNPRTSRFQGRFLVESAASLEGVRYERLDDLSSYGGAPCILVRTLDPDYVLLLGSLRLIVTERGSALSHLAIVALEQQVPVFLVSSIRDHVTQDGHLSIIENELTIE